MINFNKPVNSVNSPDNNSNLPVNTEKEDNEVNSIFENENVDAAEDLFLTKDGKKNFPVKISNPEKVLKAKFDEDGNFCVEYSNNTEEIYVKNKDDDKFFLAEKIRNTDNGYVADYYSPNGKITETSSVSWKNDVKNNIIEVCEDFFEKETGYRIVSTYKYTGEEQENNLCEINFKGKYNGQKYETNYKITRDDNSNVISVLQSEKQNDKSTVYSKFEGVIAREALNGILKEGYYGGYPNERIHHDKKGNFIEKRINEIGSFGEIKSISEYDKDDNLIKKQEDFAKDGNIGTSYQGNTGDCYLLAAINALSQSSIGQEILRNNISENTDKNGQKVYTVKFPGAQKAANSLKNNLEKSKVYIKGEYTVTQAEMDAANKNFKAFSYGDQDVLLYELAFDKYRNDVKQTVEENNINVNETYNYAGLEGYKDINNPINGGFGSEVKLILTGQRPETWWNSNPDIDNTGVLLDEKNHTVTIKNIHKSQLSADSNKNQDSPQNYRSLEGFWSTSNIIYEDKKRDEMIQKIIEDFKDGKLDNNIVTIGINAAYHGDSEFGPHEVAVIGMSENEVTILDSNDRTLGEARKYTMSMDDFKRATDSLDVLTLKTP